MILDNTGPELVIHPDFRRALQAFAREYIPDEHTHEGLIKMLEEPESRRWLGFKS